MKNLSMLLFSVSQPVVDLVVVHNLRQRGCCRIQFAVAASQRRSVVRQSIPGSAHSTLLGCR